MELDQFISTALVQISRGIESASEELKDSSAVVNPRNVIGTNGADDQKVYGYLADERSGKLRKVVHQIDFDVAVVAAEGSTTKGSLGIKVGGLGIGAQGQSEDKTTSESRIKFSIPMVLPTEE
ncbi:hypothetical protein [Vibrio gigantis]|uniref:Uncharacterized protein n=1 Tax=Vibrio gigantis TaxID=296199 RepID=A0A5M9NNN4_9VIBR|nr:hypothetical protein [Vibrio gigantis]KAA8672286.1 hypothetical protein F4W18_15090 [Vibrio gigantis]